MPILPLLAPLVAPDPTALTVQLRAYEVATSLAFTCSIATRESAGKGALTTLIEPTNPTEGDLEALAKRTEIATVGTPVLRTLSGQEATVEFRESVDSQTLVESRFQVLPILLKDGRIRLQLKAKVQRNGSPPETGYEATAIETVKEGAPVYFLISRGKGESRSLLITARVSRS